MVANSSNKRVLIVDDDEILQVFLKKCLSTNNYDVFSLESGEGIAYELENNHIDIIVLDVLLPGKDGFYWLNWIKSYHPYLPVIMASVKTSEDDRLKGLESGALDYIVKPFRERELLIRVEHVLNHLPVNSGVSNIIQIGDVKIDTKSHNVHKDGRISHLTFMEVNILKLLFLNAGIALSRDEIMEQVKGVKHNPLDRSIDIHINKIRKKIEVDPASPACIRTIRGKGYCLQLPTN